MESRVPIKWNPFQKGHTRDPYPMFKQLREEEPVHRAQTGEYILTRYEDVRNVLRNKEFKAGNRLEWLRRAAQYGKDQGEDWDRMPGYLGHFLLFMNPPDHTIVREWLSGLWPEADQFEELIHVEIQKLYDQIDLNDFDINKDLTRPLAGRVIARVLGLMVPNEEELWHHGFRIVKTMDLYLSPSDIREIAQSLDFFNEFMKSTVKSKTLDPDGILASLRTSDELISEEQFFSISTFLFIAGLETASSLMGSALFHLADTGIMSIKGNERNAVDEFARYDSPVQLLGRFSHETIKIQDVTIPEGSPLTLVIGSANRDPEFFDDPDTMNFDRSRNPHLAFGAGAHRCLGDQLAKLETKCLLESVSHNFKEVIKLTEPDWEEHLSIRRMKNTRIALKS